MVISLNGFGFMYINSQGIFLNIILAPLFHVAVELLKIPTLSRRRRKLRGKGVSVFFFRF